MGDSERQNWTVMLYMAGDNNLSDRCVDDLREIIMAGSTKEVTVKVQIDRSSAFDNKPQRYTVTGPPGDSNGSPGVIEQFREKAPLRPYNTGKEQPLLDFIDWAIKDSPKDRYMLVLWGHASPMNDIPLATVKGRRSWGRRNSRWHHDRRPRPSTQASSETAFFKICSDEYTGDALTNVELQNVLKKVKEKIGRPIDILGLDACLMSMVELCYEMRDYAKLMIASESLIPSTSWPYHWILSALRGTPKMSAEDLCRTIVKNYIDYYSDYDETPVQLSACNLSKCEALRTAVQALARELKKRLQKQDLTLRNAIISAHLRAQPYDEEEYYDLNDFCYMLKESSEESDVELREACDAVMRVVVGTDGDGFVLSSNSTNDPDMQFSYGTSIYLPWTDVSKRYGYLEFPKQTNWDEFLELYTDKTTKEPRDARVQ